MITFKSLPSLVSCNSQRYTILLPELFEFGPELWVSIISVSQNLGSLHDAASNDRYALSVETIHPRVVRHW